MVFVGNGSLLKNAITYTLNRNFAIDLVYSQTAELKDFCSIHNIPYKICDVNTEVVNIEKLCKDKLVLSINNDQIFLKEILSLNDFRFYNIHNGILPKYRGLPEISIIFVILNDEKQYGVTLHEIDKGIDTGDVIDFIVFDISYEDTFQTVMFKSIRYCHEIFIKNFDSIFVNREFRKLEVDKSVSKLYSYNDLNSLHLNSSKESIYRATDIGVFRLYYEKLYKIIEYQLSLKSEVNFLHGLIL
jgi:methionyl-tRNA formyltransferase